MIPSTTEYGFISLVPASTIMESVATVASISTAVDSWSLTSMI
jgi:hypothetical protein